jgi:hypothetical protein
MVDVNIENHGSIIIFSLLNDSAKDWIKKNVVTEPCQFLGRKLAVEPRYVQGLIDGMENDGLFVEVLT